MPPIPLSSVSAFSLESDLFHIHKIKIFIFTNSTLKFILKGLVALVTGGASGLGRATAERFIRQGGKVVICDLPTSAGQNVAKEFGDSCVFSAADVSTTLSMKINGYFYKDLIFIGVK